MSFIDPPDADTDPFGPPAIPTMVACLHCGQEYESYLIEWRVKQCADGQMRGFWCCPVPGCDGKGFCFDILPVDPHYQDEFGSVWVDADEVQEECNLPEDNEPDDGPQESGDEEALPW
jgi:hypothetical protein